MACSRLTSVSRGHRVRIFMDAEVIEKCLALEPGEIQALWTPIEWVVDPKYWSCTLDQPSVFMNALANISYALMQHMITHFARGNTGVAGLSLGEKATKNDQRVTSNVNDPAHWPQVSPLIPKTPEEWETHETHYPSALDNEKFKSLVARYEGISATEGTNDDRGDDNLNLNRDYGSSTESASSSGSSEDSDDDGGMDVDSHEER